MPGCEVKIKILTMIRLKKVLLFGLISLCGALSAYAQDFTDTLTVYFPMSRSNFNPQYMDNGKRCDQFLEHARSLSSNKFFRVHRVDFVGSASPDGPEAFNAALAQRRADNLVKYLHKKVEFADSVVFVSTVTEDWDALAGIVRADKDVPQHDEVLAVIGNDELGEGRESELKKNYPASWTYMAREHFPFMRSFTIFMHVGVEYPEIQEVENELDMMLQAEEELVIEQDFFKVQTKDTVALLPMPWKHELTVKTNGVGWAMGQINVAAEYDIAPHWSIAVPFYYSGGYNYFSKTIKFRGIVLQPEARYYFNADLANDGWYVGAHLGVGWYNFAVNGDYRIQDHGGKRPAWGGGIGGGYTMQFKKHPAWGMEFALGAGVYDALYDKFYNEVNGPIAESSVRKVFFGIDNAAVSVTYKFGLKRKEGKR